MLQRFARKCDECGALMNEGYVIGGGEQYYCSDKCLHKQLSAQEFADLYDEGRGESYFTVWEEEPEYQYLEDGTEIC